MFFPPCLLLFCPLILIENFFYYSNSILNIFNALRQFDVFIHEFLKAFIAKHIKTYELLTVKTAMAFLEFFYEL